MKRGAEGSGAQRRPLDTAWIAIAILVPAFVALAAAVRTTDLAYHVRLGASMLDHHGLVRADSFTFTAVGTPWTDQQWLGQVLLALGYRLGGWDSLIVLRASLVGIALSFLYLACRARGSSPRTSSLLSIAAFAIGAPAFGLRPQLFAIALFAIALWAVAGSDRHPRRLWLVPGSTVLVVNIHGSFPLFVLLTALVLSADVIARRPWKRSASVFAATVLATVINPFGAGAWTYVVALSTNPQIRTAITEWRPLSAGDYIGAAALAAIVGVVAVLARRSTVVTWTDLSWLGLFLIPALASERAVVWWAFVAAMVVAGWGFGASPTGETAPAAIVPRALVGTMVAAVVVALPWWRGGADLRDAPLGLTREVAALPSGSRLFVDQGWGSWFEFAVPNDTVFVDSRIELFGAKVWDDYDQVAFAGAGWKDVLARRHPDAIVAPSDWALIPYLRADPGWRVAYEDADGVLFVPASG